MTIVVRPLTPTIGAELGGVQLATTSDDDIASIYQELLRWKVVFFRDQELSTGALVAFSRRFGELEVHPLARHIGEHPEVSTVFHGPDDPGTENHWHHDVTWRRAPSLGSVARMVVAPPLGGDTLFADMCAAYDGLPDQIKSRVDGQVARHDFPHFRAGLRAGGATDDQIAAFDSAYPNPHHPVIRTHPETGRRAIFVNAAFTQEIVGLPPAESIELLRLLYHQARIPEYQVRFTWREGSVAFWDNRACQHYAVSDYWPHERRLERVTIAGSVPFYDPERRPTEAVSSPFFFSSLVDRS